MKITHPIRFVVLILVLGCIGHAAYDLTQHMPQSVGMPPTSRAEIALYKLEAPTKKIPELSRAVTHAANITDISPELLVALIKTESTFNYRAVSSKGYKGLLQTPWATQKWADIDILYGARILREKLEYSDGDLRLALTLYKGGDNSLAREYADQTLKLYKSLLGG